MGRPRKTIAELRRAGTYRPSRHLERWLEERGRETPGTPPEKPADLVGSAGELWDELLPLLSGVVRAEDGYMLRLLCETWAEWRRCAAWLGTIPPSDPRYTGAMRAAAKCSDLTMSIARKFWLSPTDRARLRFGMAVSPPAVTTRPPTQLDRLGRPPV